MESIYITISNYRNISSNFPLTIQIKEGITFILGPNNSGKSNLLKFIFEFRRPLNYIFDHSQQTINKLKQYKFLESEVDYNLDLPFDHLVNRNEISNPIKFKIAYKQITYNIEIKSRNETNPNSNDCNLKYSMSNNSAESNIEFSLTAQSISELKKMLIHTVYIGPFRASQGISSQGINIGNQMDIVIGSHFVNTWSQWANGNDMTKSKLIDGLIEELKELFGYKRFNIVPSDWSNPL